MTRSNCLCEKELTRGYVLEHSNVCPDCNGVLDENYQPIYDNPRSLFDPRDGQGNSKTREPLVKAERQSFI